MEIQGLSSIEVKERLDRGLSNKSAGHKTKTYGEVVIENIFSLFNLITFGIISFVIFFYFQNGDQRLVLDSLGIFFIALTNTSIAMYQEVKSKIALDKVNLLLKRQAAVIRNGKKEMIDQTEIVVDDIIEIARGDQVVVDGRVISSKRLEIDESLLTGESIPIEKSENEVLLSGSFCVSGGGYYRAEKVGADSHAQSVTGLAKKYKFILTPLQKRINLILKVLFGIAIILVAVEIISFNTRISGNGDFTDHIRKIATILISLVPQGLVLTASVTFAVGVFRISRIGAIIQKLNAVESFSNVQYVCMDKTGTLTENKLRVHSVTRISESADSGEMEKLLGTFAFHSTEKNATIRALETFSTFGESIYISEMPFSSDTKMSIIELEIQGIRKFYVLGAYDILASQCTDDARTRTETLFRDNKLGDYRNLLFGTADNADKALLDSRNTDKLIINPYAVVSISDTVRKDVLDAIRLFESNNIKLKILTGDAPEPVKAIIREIGWDIPKSGFITGDELGKLSGEEYGNAVLDKSVFARLKPEQKLSIIESLKERNIYTAMIGDGVNDLPAIKQAHIGIAMEEGSAITKEVADIVLLKNKFSLLPQIFDEGNKIVNSVSAIAKLFLTKNFLVILMSVVSLILLFDFPLTPRRVSLLNVFSIGLPAFIITLRNQNISKCFNFTKDVFSYVVISSVLLLLFGYGGYYLMGNLLAVPVNELEMGMVTIIILIAVANFLIVASESEGKKLIYYVYGASLMVIFILLSVTRVDLNLINILQKFYEIQHLNLRSWILILLLSAAGSGLLIAAQTLRRKLVKADIRN